MTFKCKSALDEEAQPRIKQRFVYEGDLLLSWRLTMTGFEGKLKTK
jgi:hypothetical protein